MSTEQKKDEQPASSGRGKHELPEGAKTHPLIDLARDPNRNKADHAKPE
jgi:hypothetical protein